MFYHILKTITFTLRLQPIYCVYLLLYTLISDRVNKTDNSENKLVSLLKKKRYFF